MKRIFSLFGAIITMISVLTSCGGHDAVRQTIAVSIPPQAALLHEITGDSVEIVTLMPAEANPEAFEITVKDMRSLSDAALYMKMGHLPFETSLTKRLRDANSDMRFVDTSDGVDLIYGTHNHGDHAHDVADPHTWTSVANLRKIASNMLGAVIEADPANSDFYTANFNRLSARLDSVDHAIASRIAAHGDRSFLIWHPSLSYFARDYGLQQIAVGEDNKEMTPGRLRDVHNRAMNEGASVMFMQQNFDARQANSIASALDVDVVVINPMDADYMNQFNIITDALTRH